LGFRDAMTFRSAAFTERALRNSTATSGARTTATTPSPKRGLADQLRRIIELESHEHAESMRGRHVGFHG